RAFSWRNHSPLVFLPPKYWRRPRSLGGSWPHAGRGERPGTRLRRPRGLHVTRRDDSTGRAPAAPGLRANGNRRLLMGKIAAVIAVLILVIAAYLGYRYWQIQSLAKKYAKASEIA